MLSCPHCQSQKIRHATTGLTKLYSFVGRQLYHCHNCQESFSLSSDFSQRSHRDTRVLKEVGVMLFAATVVVSLILFIGYTEVGPGGIRNL